MLRNLGFVVSFELTDSHLIAVGDNPRRQAIHFWHRHAQGLCACRLRSAKQGGSHNPILRHRRRIGRRDGALLNHGDRATRRSRFDRLRPFRLCR